MAEANPIDEQSQIRIPAEDAYRALLPEMNALSEGEVATPTVDLLTAVSIVLGALPKLQALRPQIAKQLPEFNLARFDNLEQYAKALHHANALHRIATTPKVGLSERADELTDIRDRLLADAQSLANHKLIDPENLKQCKTAIGYKPLVADIAILLAVFKEHWPAIKGRTPVTVDMLNDANDRAEELHEAAALKDQAPVTAGEAAEHRRRAYAIFARAYKDAQRAVAYLRADHDDAEEIAPSIFTKRVRRRDDEPSLEASATTAPSGNAPSGSAPGVARAPAGPLLIEANGMPITPPLTG